MDKIKSIGNVVKRTLNIGNSSQSQPKIKSKHSNPQEEFTKRASAFINSLKSNDDPKKVSQSFEALTKNVSEGVLDKFLDDKKKSDEFKKFYGDIYSIFSNAKDEKTDMNQISLCIKSYLQKNNGNIRDEDKVMMAAVILRKTQKREPHLAKDVLNQISNDFLKGVISKKPVLSRVIEGTSEITLPINRNSQ